MTYRVIHSQVWDDGWDNPFVGEYASELTMLAAHPTLRKVVTPDGIFWSDAEEFEWDSEGISVCNETLRATSY